MESPDHMRMIKTAVLDSGRKKHAPLFKYNYLSSKYIHLFKI
jgi:hypothetical protein